MSTLDDKKRAMIHQRVTELLIDVQRKAFSTLEPIKIVDLFKLGIGEPPLVGIRATDVVAGFYVSREKSDSGGAWFVDRPEAAPRIIFQALYSVSK